jgi:hypothetical protein
VPDVSVAFSDPFLDELREVGSDALANEVWQLAETLRHFPQLGTTAVRDSIASRYGQDIRKLPVGSFLVIYCFDGGSVTFLALISGSRVR